MVLLQGELDATTNFTYKHATCNMQNAWTSEVLGPEKLATTDAEAFAKIFGEQGVMWTYLNATAKPFLNQGADGYSSVITNGWQISWDKNFLSFINGAAAEKRKRDTQTQRKDLSQKLNEVRANARIKGIDARIQQIDQDQLKFAQTVFKVEMSSLPVRANAEALIQPYGVNFTLNCAQAPQRLTQLNYSASQSLTWTSSTCGDAELRIFVESFSVSKKWTGPLGFFGFLDFFRSGRGTFAIENFSDQQDKLKQLGITDIDVIYKINGAVPLIAAVKKSEEDVTERNSLVAEKATLEQGLSYQQQANLSVQIEKLERTGPRSVVPKTATVCTF